MLKNAAVIGALLVFAFSILVTSTLKTANPAYVFSPAPASVLGEEATGSADSTVSYDEVAYYLPHHGILPTHALWPLKAARDKAWVLVTFDTEKKANLLLLFADKRLGMAKELFETGQAEKGVPAVYKAEQYLEESYLQQEKLANSGVDTTDLLTRLALSSLKHKEIINEVFLIAPEDARPYLTEALNKTNSVYEKAKAKLSEKNRPVPLQ